MTRIALWSNLDVFANQTNPAELADLGITDIIASGANSLIPPKTAPSDAAPILPASWEASFVANYHAAGIKVFRATYLDRRDSAANAWPSMLVPASNNAAWTAVNTRTDLWARAVKAAGYDGLGVDWESGRFGTSWNWMAFATGAENIAGTMYLAELRGSAWMQTLANAWPGVPIFHYSAYLPGAWWAWLQNWVNGYPFPESEPESVQYRFLRGAWARGGYGRQDVIDAAFYKGKSVPVPPAPYPNTTIGAAQFDRDKTAEYVATFVAPNNPSGQPNDRSLIKAGLFIAISPIEAGDTNYSDALTVAEANALLDAGAAISDVIALYHHGSWPKITVPGGTFSYLPYRTKLRSLSSSSPPTTETVTLTGKVTDSSGQTKTATVPFTIQRP